MVFWPERSSLYPEIPRMIYDAAFQFVTGEETDSHVCLGVLIPGEIGDADVSLDLLHLLQYDRHI